MFFEIHQIIHYSFFRFFGPEGTWMTMSVWARSKVNLPVIGVFVVVFACLFLVLFFGLCVCVFNG